MKKGKGYITKKGYRIIYKPDHPNAKYNGTIFEHRYVMSEKLGRPLRSDEIIHHKNGNRCDNRPENLEIMTFGDHSRLHKLIGGTCMVSGCKNIHRTRGTCNMHYKRYRKAGIPLPKASIYSVTK